MKLIHTFAYTYVYRISFRFKTHACNVWQVNCWTYTPTPTWPQCGTLYAAMSATQSPVSDKATCCTVKENFSLREREKERERLRKWDAVYLPISLTVRQLAGQTAPKPRQWHSWCYNAILQINCLCTCSYSNNN